MVGGCFTVLRIDEKNRAIELVLQMDVKIAEFSLTPNFRMQKT